MWIFGVYVAIRSRSTSRFLPCVHGVVDFLDYEAVKCSGKWKIVAGA
jgi:hypothetical protein